MTVVAIAVAVAALGIPAAALPAPNAVPRVPARGATPAAFTPDKTATGEVIDETTVLIRFRAAASSEERAGAARRHGVELATRVPGTDFVEARVHGGERARQVLESLQRDGTVAETTFNRIRTASATPNDFGWPLGQAPYLAPLRLERAWDQAQGSGVVVAVLDSGVRSDHPDLAGKLVPGRDIVNNDSIPQDDFGHGTAVTGVIAANTGNGMGIAGVGWHARAMPIKVLDWEGKGTDADIAAGIVWAADHGADVINMSLGGYGSAPVLEQAVEYARARDVLLVAASGNHGTGIPAYPAALPGVIGVGATDDNGQLVAFSNHGDWIDLVAPGVDIASTSFVPSTDYEFTSGTSFSAPIVAGIAALARSRYTTESAGQIEARLLAGARDAGPIGRDRSYGAGVVDAFATLGGPLPYALPRVGADEDSSPNAASVLDIDEPGLTGQITPETDDDWYSFEVPADGYWHVAVRPSASPAGSMVLFDPVFEVFDGSLHRLAYVDDAVFEQTEERSVAIAAGTAYVRVYNYFGTTGASPYTVEVDTNAVTAIPSPLPTFGQHWLRGMSPPDGDVVFGSAAIDVQLEGAIDATSINSTTVRLGRGAADTAVPSTVLLDGSTLRVTPATSLAGGYRLRVQGLKRPSGEVQPAPIDVRFWAGDYAGDSAADTAIISSPASSTTDGRAAFAFATVPRQESPGGPLVQPAASFYCRVDAAPWTPCGSPHSIDVAAGHHKFAVFSVRPSGAEDTSEAVATWTYAPPPPPPPPAPPPAAPPAAPAARQGYWMIGRTGDTFAFGDAPWLGNTAQQAGVDVVDLEPTTTGNGYWTVTNRGHVFSFGDARWFGGSPALNAQETVTSLSRNADGSGYWLFTSTGRVLPYGAVAHFGDMSNVRLNAPVLDSIPTVSGRGYYMVAADGGIFTFGDAAFHGSMGSVRLNKPVQSLVPDADGTGYWLVASDGGIFAFAAPFYGSMGSVALNRPVTGMVGFGNGYLMVGEDGGIFTFGAAPFKGSLGANPPSQPIVAVAALAG